MNTRSLAAPPTASPTAAPARPAMPPTDPALGLTGTEAERRRAQGLGHRTRRVTSRTHWQIVRENLFTFLNMTLIGIGVLLIGLGLVTEALVSSGIAMQSGSQATRAAADIVLLNDSFGALPAAFREGQRVRMGLQGALSLFLTRAFVAVLVILLIVTVQAGFPFSPASLSLLTTLTVGIPAIGIALWAQPATPPRGLGPRSSPSCSRPR